MARRRSSYYDNYWPRYETTRPIPVKDGIAAKSQRGKFVRNWWADRWVAALKRLMDSGRLSRGRSYARRGQVPLRVGALASVPSASAAQCRPVRFD